MATIDLSPDESTYLLGLSQRRQEVSDIQDQAYSEAIDEIERLKQYASQCETSVHSTQEHLQLEREEWQRTLLDLRSLLTRAADALEKHSIAIAGEVRDIIVELRKAAE